MKLSRFTLRTSALSANFHSGRWSRIAASIWSSVSSSAMVHTLDPDWLPESRPVLLGVVNGTQLLQATSSTPERKQTRQPPGNWLR
ncbi:hypothetical protein GCM10009743_55620 [Kribbella swartbergensis]